LPITTFNEKKFLSKEQEYIMSPNIKEIKYKFNIISTQQEFEYSVFLDRQTGYIVTPKDSKEAEWTSLEFCKCPICPYKEKEVKNCPIAYNLSGFIDFFLQFTSFEKAKITVTTNERTSYKEDGIQEGMRSIVGIFMASSGCLHMELLKPMALNHLPFASVDETIFRHIGNYLIRRYFMVHGKTEDIIDLKEIDNLHNAIDTVN
jgi:hypothetical protein